ncbi:MAG: hypothetical protein WC755_09880, partial [Candidatus Woesearchaeota archaeon]
MQEILSLLQRIREVTRNKESLEQLSISCEEINHFILTFRQQLEQLLYGEPKDSARNIHIFQRVLRSVRHLPLHEQLIALQRLFWDPFLIGGDSPYSNIETPVGIVFDVPINGKQINLPIAIEEPSNLASIQSSANLLNRANESIRITMPNEYGTAGQIIFSGHEIHEGEIDTEAIHNYLMALENSSYKKLVEGHGGKILKAEAKHYTHEESKFTSILIYINCGEAMGASKVTEYGEQLRDFFTSKYEIDPKNYLTAIVSNKSHEYCIAEASFQIPIELLKAKDIDGTELNGEEVAKKIVE